MLHEKNNEIKNATECYQKAIQLDPTNEKVYMKFAQFLERQGKNDDSIYTYQQAIDLNSEDFRLYQSLGNILFKDNRLDEAIDAYQNAIQLQPKCSNLYAFLGRYQMEKGELDRAIGSYKQAIKLQPKQPLWVHKHLENMLKEKEDLRVRGFLEAGNSEVKINKVYENIWNSVNQANLEAFDIINCNYPTDLNCSRLESYFMQASHLKVIKLHSLTRSDKLFLFKNNISLKYLNLIKEDRCHHRFHSQKNGHEYEFKDDVSQVHKCGKAVNYKIEFQQATVETGSIYVTSPISGNVLKSQHSFLFAIGTVVGVYRFVCEEVFYVLAGTAIFDKIAVYFPRLELIIYLQNRNFNSVLMCSKLKALLVSRWKEVINFIRYCGEWKVLVALGFHGTPSHHLVNELTGISRLYKSKLLDTIDLFLVGDNQYFGSLEEIFPEISPDKILRVSDIDKEKKIPDIILGQKFFGTAVRDAWVSEDLTQRIYKASLRKCDSSFLFKAEELKKLFPLILVTIRSGSKRAWSSQVEGLARLINKLAIDYPNLGIVFDGVSHVNKRDSSFSQDGIQEEAWIKQDKAVADQILSLLPKNMITTYNSIGCMMHESIILCHAVDLYLAPFGGGLSKVNLLANKPGVVHSNLSTLNSPILNYWYTKFQRENGIAPSYVSIEHIVDTKNDSTSQLPRDSSLYDAYECDWTDLFDKIVEIIQSLPERKQDTIAQTES